MKGKSTFAQLLTIIIVALIGIILTLIIAFWVGSSDAQIFDLRNLNWANVVPVILIGGFITCVTVGIVVMIVSKNVFMKIRDYFLEDKTDGGKNK